MGFSVVIPAAGMGSRMGLGYNKILLEIDNEPIYIKTIRKFLDIDECTEVIVVLSDSELTDLKPALLELSSKIKVCVGGSTRQASVFNGLSLVSEEYVLIHDCARPYITKEKILEVYEETVKHKAVLLSVPSKDSVKVVRDGCVVESLARDTIYYAQTPQSFEISLIIKAHTLALADNYIGTDDTELVAKYTDVVVKNVVGDYSNIKITTKDDINV